MKIVGAGWLLVAGCVVQTGTPTGPPAPTPRAAPAPPAVTLGEPSRGADQVPIPPVDAVVSTTGSEHCGKITRDEVWARDRNPHIVTCGVSVEGARLTIGPGVEVRVKGFVGLSATGGKPTPTILHVLGTPEEPVLFTLLGGPEAKPKWYGVGASHTAPGDHILLRNAIIERTGPPSYPTVPWGALEASAAVVAVDGLTLRDNDGHGFYLVKGASFAAGSRGLRSTRNSSAGLIEVSAAHTVPETGAELRGNALDAVIVKGSGSRVVGNVIWEDLGVPYFADPAHGASLHVGAKGVELSVLTLGPGVRLLFAGGGIQVGYQAAAALAMRGTRDRPVVLSGWNGKDQTPVWWGGVEFRPDTVGELSILEHVRIGFGGATPYVAGNLKLFKSSPILRHAVLHDSRWWGIDMDRWSKPTLVDVRYERNRGDTHVF